MNEEAGMKQLTPRQAHEFLQQHPEAVFIDCRSEIEYLFVGHPVGAIHIAWQDGPDWDVNPDFLGHARKAASVNRPVLLICRSGRRSADAGRYLEKKRLPRCVQHPARLRRRHGRNAASQHQERLAVRRTALGADLKPALTAKGAKEREGKP
jgi:rhodanese-related sulfurtransferase